MAPYVQDDCTVGECDYSRVREGYRFELSCDAVPAERNLIDVIDRERYTILPNTAGCKNVEEALLTATPEIIGEAAAMQEVFRTIGRLARSSMTVLITGESGTGKDLTARAIVSILSALSTAHGPRICSGLESWELSQGRSEARSFMIICSLGGGYG